MYFECPFLWETAPTVDGRNPAPPEMYKTPVNKWDIYAYQLVLAGFQSHQQYIQKKQPQVSTETHHPSIKCKQANAKAPEIMSKVRSGFDLVAST